MGCYFLAASQSPNLASHERFFATNTRAALMLDERIKCWAREEGLNVCPAPLGPRSRRPLPSRTHPPLCKRGTFYFAKKRNFLLCVDTARRESAARNLGKTWAKNLAKIGPKCGSEGRKSRRINNELHWPVGACPGSWRLDLYPLRPPVVTAENINEGKLGVRGLSADTNTG